MSNLKNVRAELEKMRKARAAKEAELRREEARPVIELVNNELMNSEDVLEKFAGYSKDEARVIAKHIVMNMDRIIHESQRYVRRKKNVLNVEKPCKSRSVIRRLMNNFQMMVTKMMVCTE